MSSQGQSNSKIELTPLQRTKIKALHELFDQADVLVKEVEDFIGEAGIPALNEMRYAGYHLAHSILLQECKFCDDQITSAINHCKRACYEASEAGIVVALLQFDEFRTEYKNVVVSDIVTDWVQIQKDFQQSQSDVNSGRARGQNDRSVDYEARMDAFRKLKAHCDTANFARDDLNAKMQERITSSRKFIITSFLAAIGIIVAGVFSYLQLSNGEPQSPVPVNEPVVTKLNPQ